MQSEMPLASSEPPPDCKRCPRLRAYRREMQEKHPGWWNRPVPAWGDPQAWLAIIGLAPGMKGANRTGRAFTGDASGDLLFATLAKAGLSRGVFASRADDGVKLNGCMIFNAVKCLPPQNKPTPKETANCRKYLTAQLKALGNLRVLVALGRIAHDSIIRHYGQRLADYPFGHASQHTLPDGRMLVDSYHCSRYNTQTRRLTPEMFEQVFELAKALRPDPA